MKFLLRDPRLLSSSPFVRFLRVRGRKNGKQRRTMKLHARTNSFLAPPQSMSDLEREGTGGGSVTSGISRGDSAQKIGAEHGHAHNYLAPRGEKWLWGFLLNDIHRRGVYQHSCIYARILNTVVSNWRNGKCIFLPLLSTMDESISFGLGRRGAESTWILLEGVCMFFLGFEGWKLCDVTQGESGILSEKKCN